MAAFTNWKEAYIRRSLRGGCTAERRYGLSLSAFVFLNFLCSMRTVPRKDSSPGASDEKAAAVTPKWG